jgi:hypothetical protein
VETVIHKIIRRSGSLDELLIFSFRITKFSQKWIVLGVNKNHNWILNFDDASLRPNPKKNMV